MKECFKSTKCTLESSSFSVCKFYGSEFWCSVDSPNLLKEVCRDGREEKAFSKKQLFLALDWSQWLLFICVVSQHADPHYKCNGLTEHNWQVNEENKGPKIPFGSHMGKLQEKEEFRNNMVRQHS